MNLPLSTFCAHKGVCTKKDAKKFIQLGYITLNNRVVKEDVLVRCNLSLDRIKLTKRVQDIASNKISVLLHKPRGYLSTFTPKAELWSKTLLTPENRIEEEGKGRLNPSELRRLLPINPLEFNASGVALFSEDRSLVAKFKECEEEYRVIFEDTLTDPKLLALSSDIHIDGVALAPLKITKLSDNVADITIQGSSSKLRKACALAGLGIKSLKRIRMGCISLGNLLCGQWLLLKKYQLV